MISLDIHRVTKIKIKDWEHRISKDKDINDYDTKEIEIESKGNEIFVITLYRDHKED